MHIGLFLAGIGLALLVLVPLSLKWRVQLTLVLPGALLAGALSGAVMGAVQAQVIELHAAAWVFAELAAIGLISLAAIALRFYRDPERVPPETDNVVLSPADGQVVYVSPIAEGSSVVCTKKGRQFQIDELMGADAVPNPACLIGIDMNILDVHINRAPTSGAIVLQKRTPGGFISLRRPESNVVNERVTTVLDNGEFRLGVVQIASRLVRRIVSFQKEGDFVEMGQRIGMITFGSQVDVLIPGLENLSTMVAPGEYVKAGHTIIARFSSQCTPNSSQLSQNGA